MSEHTPTPISFIYNINVRSDPAAGLQGFNDVIAVDVESGDPGGGDGEFAEFLRQSLAEWFDDGPRCVTLTTTKNVECCNNYEALRESHDDLLAAAEAILARWESGQNPTAPLINALHEAAQKAKGTDQ